MKRHLFLLGVMAAALLVGYLFMIQSQKRSLTPHEKVNFVGLDSGAVNRIEIGRLGSKTEFQLAGNGWQVIIDGTSKRADNNTVNNIANLAHNLTVGDIISSNPEKQMLFEVDTLIGRTVAFYRDTQELGRLIVGKAGSDFRSTYVRKPDSKDVYLATAAITRLLDRPVSGYRDKSVHALDAGAINSIIVKSKDSEYQLSRADSLWTINDAKSGSAPADAAKASAFATMLSTLRINDFVDPNQAQSVSFSPDADRVTIALASGSAIDVELTPVDTSAKSYYLRTSADPDLFTVPEHVRNNIMKKPDDLK